MPRLIDADALIEVLKAQDYSNAPNTLEEWTPQDMTNVEIFDINNAPTVDAVEVVRCKDCKWLRKVCLPNHSLHSGMVGDKSHGWLECDMRGGIVKVDDYCSLGYEKDELEE